MTRRPLAAALAAAFLTAAPQARAAMIVYDPTAYAKLLEEARTALTQLEQLRTQVDQGRQLFASLNTASGAGRLAATLGAPDLRQLVPDAGALDAAGRGDLTGLGALGARIDALRRANRLFTPPPGDPAGADLEAAGNRAARDLALGEAVAAGGAQRLAGLQTLQSALDAAPNARAVLDLQARTATEQAMIANDQMRLQGLAMAQAAEDRLERQRERERAEAAREARMALYRQGFQ